jgi:flagellar hook-basal body complex protein FliE
MAINPVSISSNALNALREANAAKTSAATAATSANSANSAAKTQTPSQTFDQLLTSLNQSEDTSNDLIQQLSGGGAVDLHQVMLGIEENDINFRVSLAMRDKLVDAYREVMRMQI